MKNKTHKWRKCSQAQQDRWAYNLIGNNGTYVEIGGHLPAKRSNTYNLEVGHNWRGFSVEFDRKYKQHWDECIERTSNIYWADAMTFNYSDAAKLNNLPSRINYLSIDIEPPENTFKALQKVINDGLVFDLITFEHDRYQSDKDYHKVACDFLLPKGYKIAVENVWHKKETRQFETWFVHEDIEHQHMTYNEWLKRVHIRST